nr:HAD family phosphatase [Pigmentibacter ruber]
MNFLRNTILSKKAILWDFDGCLCDSEKVHYLAYAKAFQICNHQLNEYDYFETFTHTGGGVAKEIEMYHLTCDPEAIRKEKAKIYWELILDKKAQFYKEIPKILQIATQNKVINAIASNSPAKEIELIISQYTDGNLPIDKIIGLEAGMKKKPAPDLYLKALKDLNLSPKEVIVFEDSERGLIAAKEAGCEAIWIKTELNDRFTTDAPYISRMTHQELLEILTH